MRQSLQNNILALREYFTLNAIQGIFRSKEIFDDVCRGIGLLFEYPYFLVCCVYTGKSIEYLYENIGNYPFGAEKMAEHFGITSQYLRRQFRKETDSP